MMIMMKSIVFSLCRRISTGSGDATKRVGFIGLGQMGTPMAQNLLNSGFQVTVYDTANDKSNGFPHHASSLQELSDSCSRIITMLPTNESVEEVYTQLSSMMSGGDSSSVKTFIDCSTVAPSITHTVYELLKHHGVGFFDAPVSGGVKGAQAGTLTFLVGVPSEDELNCIRDLLLAMGKRIFACGPIGSGQVAKICNNLILGASMVSLSEALNLGKRCGLDPAVLSDIINASSGRCWSSECYNPVPGIMKGTPACEEYRGGFASKLILKDLGLAQQAALQVDAPLPATNMAYEIYQRMISDMDESKNKDFSSIYEYLSRNSEFL